MPQLLLCKRYLAGSMRGQLSLEQVRARLQLMTEFISVFEKVNPGLTKWRGKMLYQVSSVTCFFNNGERCIQPNCILLLR